MIKLSKNYTLNDILISIFVVLLFTMVSFPAIFQSFKLILLLILLSFIVLKFIKTSKMFINKEIFYIFSILVVFNIMFMLNGYINGFYDAYKLMSVNLMWPILWIIFIFSINIDNSIHKIANLMLYSFYFIVSYFYIFLLYKFSIIPDFLFINLERSNQSGLYFANGELEVSINALSSLMYLLPFVLTFIVLSKKISLPFLFMISIGIVAAILSGRRGLQITIPIAIVFIIFFKIFIKDKSLKASINKRINYSLVIGFIIFTLIFTYLSFNNIIDFNKIINFMIEGFDFTNSNNESSYTRYLIFHDLIGKWSDFPLFGLGFAAHGDIIRNQEMPWSYELTYLSILFQTGLVGIILYVCSVFWINYKLVQILKYGPELYTRLSFALLVSLDTFLIASATNSYLLKFDYLFCIFLPLMLINSYEITRKKYE